MRKELDEKLCKDFPLLYRQRGFSMNESCMYWGFSHGDGWYDIVREMSSKLEVLIQKYLDEKKPEDTVCFCGCKIHEHAHALWFKTSRTDEMYRISSKLGLLIQKQCAMSVNNKCMTIHKIPYKINKYRFGYVIPQSKIKYATTRTIVWVINTINGLFEFISPVISRKVPCDCRNGWEPYHPSISQIKEKFGLLRVYMDDATDEMYKIIYEYQEKSSKICEICGKPGTTKEENYWINTLCNSCREEKTTNEKETYGFTD